MSLPSSLHNIDVDTLKRFHEIIQRPVIFDSHKEEEACGVAIDGLTPEEVEATARTSYAYWALHILGDDAISAEITRKMAVKVARWHVQYVGGHDGEKAMKRLQEAVLVRKEHQMELFRTCFDKDATSDNEQGIMKEVQSDLEKQLQVLRGQDKVGRAVVTRLPRMKGGTTESAYIRQQLYTADRSAAVTEFVSAGEHETVCAIFNTQNQNSRNTPPLKWQLSVVSLLQQIFPGRMGHVLVLESSFMIRQLFNAVKPFLSASLRDSIDLVAGKAKDALLEKTLPDPNILTEDGKLTKPVDLQKYLHEVPYYCPYDYQS